MATSAELISCFQDLTKNDAGTFLDVSELLLKYANNIIRQPAVTKYRSIRLGNKTFENRVLPVSGALECLFAAGFEEDDENIALRENHSLEALRSFQKLLAQERLVLVSSQMNNLNFMQSTEQRFSQKLSSSAEHVMIYEDPLLQQKARDKIPYEDLRRKAGLRLDRIASTSSDNGDIPPDMRDCLLLELLKWFKDRFFRWVSAPPCGSCGQRTQHSGMLDPTQEERRWGAGQVEGYRCGACNRVERFPRYNHPEKLLETRTGRCGEWANCFTLCCRALGFEARHVVDWTDHVWTEVYSQSQQRWLHTDPCENCCDKPLLYEHGWNKQLSYIIAFSFEEVVDVTWRYTAKEHEVIGRRKECREKWLMDSISRLNTKRQANQTGARKKELQERFGKELVEYLSPKSAADGEDQGRSSGSLSWRMARGEVGSGGGVGGATAAANQPGFVFRPSKSEKAGKCIHMKYNTANNKYVRVTDSNAETEDWETCVHESLNMFRKQEFDWNMAYLAREESSMDGSVSWKFDLSGSGLVIDHVRVKASSTTFESGQVKWSMEGAESSTVLDGSNNFTEVRDLSGSMSGVLKATIPSIGYWQHGQLFRQKDDATSEYLLDVQVFLKEG